MVFFELVGAGVEFGMTHLVQSQLGLLGPLLLTLLVVGMRTQHPRLTWWAALLFIVLMAQA